MLEFVPFKDEKDYADFSQLAFDPKVMEMNFGRVFTKEEAQAFFQGMVSLNRSQDMLPGYCKVLLCKNEKAGGDAWVIPASPCFIGMCGMNWNEEYKGVEIEYMLLPEYWHQGLGTEIVRRMLAYLETSRIFGNKNTERTVIAITDPGNKASEKILRKFGFSCEKTYTVSDGSMARLYRKN